MKDLNIKTFTINFLTYSIILFLFLIHLLFSVATIISNENILNLVENDWSGSYRVVNQRYYYFSIELIQLIYHNSDIANIYMRKFNNFISVIFIFYYN